MCGRIRSILRVTPIELAESSCRKRTSAPDACRIGYVRIRVPTTHLYQSQGEITVRVRNWLVTAVFVFAGCTSTPPEKAIVNDAASALGGADKVQAVNTLTIQGGGENLNSRPEPEPGRPATHSQSLGIQTRPSTSPAIDPGWTKSEQQQWATQRRQGRSKVLMAMSRLM